VNRFCPEDDRKLIANIRKTKERNKRHKDSGQRVGEVTLDEKGKSKGRYESEYDEAIYGSSSESDGSGTLGDDVLGRGENGVRGGNERYIVEDDEEPLDLLDYKALANISSTKPHKHRKPDMKKAQIDMNGKLMLGGNSDEDEAMVLDAPAAHGDDVGGGVGAYVKALKGRDAVRRGRGGRLKFSTKRSVDDEIEVEEDVQTLKQHLSKHPRNRMSLRGGLQNGTSGKGVAAGRKKWPGEERRSGRGHRIGGHGVMKSPRGKLGRK